MSLVCPPVVCLVGSTKFRDQILTVARRETLAGNIVVLPLVFGHSEPGGQEALGPGVKELLDELHLHKIMLADEVLVVNPGGYIGEGGRREIAWARALIRCGYPKTVKDYLPEAEALVLSRLGPKFATDKVAREVAYVLAKDDHFGGRERTLHLESKPELLGQVLVVHEVVSVTKPGGLGDLKVHRIAKVVPSTSLGFTRCFDPNALVQIPVAHLELVVEGT